MTYDFAAKLTKLFEAIEPQFRTAQVQKYRTTAEAQLGGWLQRLEGPAPTGRYAWDQMYSPEYVAIRQPTSRHDWTWMQEHRADYYANVQKAKRDANAAVDQAKAHFISKQSGKLISATKNYAGRGRIKVSGQLGCNVVITGHLDVHFNASYRFRLAMSMIVNYRYRPRFTSFYQFPARFQHVIVNGEMLDRVSEAQMAELFV